MTVTTLGLNGQPTKFLGAYVRNISESLGLSSNPSTATITLVEDPLTGANFEEPRVGTFAGLTVGPTWSFYGIIKRFEKDIRNIGGRQLNVTLNDVREVMKSIPVILAPGYEYVTRHVVEHTDCSVLDVHSPFQYGLINLSDWNQSGMPFRRIVSALHGDDVLFGTTHIPIGQQSAQAFGEVYRFNLSNLVGRVDPDYRVNTNLNPISNLIDDLAQKFSFDWFVDASEASDGVIDITIRIIDRSSDQTTLSLPEFLDNHNGKVISCTSGVELRNDIACMALLGAPTEQMRRVSIDGMANEPIDLAPESGNHRYLMNETEMRIVLGGRNAWEIWLGIPEEDGGGGGFSRYGGQLQDDSIEPLIPSDIKKLLDEVFNISKNKARKTDYLLGVAQEKFANAGKVFDKLQSHAEATYGRRWVHAALMDEIIESAWTRGAVFGNQDPYEYFKQSDGRTRAFVEFNNEDSGGQFSIGLGDLTNLFGDQNVFGGVTQYGDTFTSALPGEPGQHGAILIPELKDQFTLGAASFDTDKTNYIFDNMSNANPGTRTKLYLACTIDKDGTICLPCPVLQKRPTPDELLNMALKNQEGEKKDADGNVMTLAENLEDIVKRLFGNELWNIHGKCFQPEQVYIPTRSRYLRYGPVFSSMLDGDTWGKLEIVQDDGYAPWEFGGLSLMSGAMQLKVDNASSLQKEIFTANITVEGYPELNIGDELGRNGNISSIGISFGGGGLTTSYGLQTFTRKFGEFSREDWARFALYNNSSATRVFPQSPTNYNENSRVNVAKQFRSNVSDKLGRHGTERFN